VSPALVLGLPELDRLLELLRADGYRTLGPVVRHGAIVFDDVATSADLPTGVGALQGPGHYRLTQRADEARFGFATGPSSLKPLVFPPKLELVRLRRKDEPSGGRGFEALPQAEQSAPRVAVLGARACDLAALGVQDRVFLGGDVRDPSYEARRAELLLISVQCTEPGGTCFCVSMGTGPTARAGFDLALTELPATAELPHRFVVEVGSPRGAALVLRLGLGAAADGDVELAATLHEEAKGKMGRSLDAEAAPSLLRASLEHPHWDEVASRCLSCASCTLACPTCFCADVRDVTTLSGDAERHRVWDSCFTMEHAYVHGGTVRPSTAARYRQWLTHKLDTWIEQFGTSGCVGCGRCITWCPAGIDLTAELAALAAPAARAP
jgi:sulfhydrogenase subunit beta (sulfur reductase)